MKSHLMIALPLLFGVAAAGPAVAQTATATAPAAASPSATVGMTVKDPAGGTVGTVTDVSEGFVTVKTDKHQAKLPAASFRATAGALLYGSTQAQLNSDIEAQLAAGEAQFKTGATVTGAGGANVGTVTAVDAESVTMKLASGKSVRLPRTGVAPSANGLVLGMTAAELDAAAAGAASASAPDAATADAAASTSTTTTTAKKRTVKKRSSKSRK